MEILNLGLALLAFVGLAILIKFTQFLLPSYLKRKGENQATFEDIGEITKRVQEVETKYSADLARLTSKLGTASQINSKQFDLELRAYEQIWASLVKVRAAFHIHRGLARTNRQEAAEENDMQNYVGLSNALCSMSELIENQRPFYSSSIWKKIRELTDEISFQGVTDIGSRNLVVNLSSYEEQKQFRAEKNANTDKINDAIDGVCEAIRGRIFELGNPEPEGRK